MRPAPRRRVAESGVPLLTTVCNVLDAALGGAEILRVRPGLEHATRTSGGVFLGRNGSRRAALLAFTPSVFATSFATSAAGRRRVDQRLEGAVTSRLSRLGLAIGEQPDGSATRIRRHVRGQRCPAGLLRAASISFVRRRRLGVGEGQSPTADLFRSIGMPPGAQTILAARSSRGFPCDLEHAATSSSSRRSVSTSASTTQVAAS